MVKAVEKARKIFMLLMVSLCLITQVSAAYGAGPSGPASDPLIVEQNKNEATGPGAVGQEIPADGQSGQPQQPAESQEVQPQQPAESQEAQPQLPAESQEAQPQQPAESQEVQPQQPAESQEVQPQQPAESQEAQPQLPAESQEVQPQQPIEEQESGEGKVKSGGRWIDPAKPMIALTFDDGPYAPVGNRIMDSLEKYNGRATFFVVGNRVPAYKTEIKRMYDNGHEIGNHTYEHKYLTKLNAAEIRSQIDRCNSAIAAVTGEAPKLVRMPGGLKNATVLENVKLPIIMWNMDTLDWKTRNAQSTYDAVMGKVKDGDIILMHEIHVPSGDAAVRLIPDLTAKGFQLVTVSELARFRGGVSSGGVYSRFRP